MTREQDNAVERIALAAGRVRVEQLAGGNVSLTIIIDPDGEAVDTSTEESMDSQDDMNAAIASAVDRGEEDRAREAFGDERVDRWFTEALGVDPDAMRAGW